MHRLNVLVIGSGGREHAICRQLARSRRLNALYILPGNPGTATLGVNVAGDPTNIALALEVARRESIDLTIVGPEDPLAAGMVDAFQAAGLRIFGPTAAGARLESDKSYAKSIMRQYVIPTADARSFDDFESARQYIATRDEAVVVKASGLARGKGVVVCNDPSDALLVAEDMLVKRSMGDAGRRILVEERLLGREASLLAIVSGRTACLLELAQDHKRLLDADQGPNTGGMGAFCPSPLLTPDALRQVQSQILVPTLDALVREELHYCGVLYLGLMFTAGGPKVLEYNCRFGDPETQAILPRMQTDLLDLLDAAVAGELESVEPSWDSRAAVCVVMAAQGYPDSPRTGAAITGIPADRDDAFVFHAGTRRIGQSLQTAGGRVLGVTALGATLDAARTTAYAVVEQIQYVGAQYRRDIGATAV